MGANGSKRQAECHRGHRLEEPNVMPATGSGRRCRACNRASSAAHNLKVRWGGGPLSYAEMDQLADAKYVALMGARL